MSDTVEESATAHTEETVESSGQDEGQQQEAPAGGEDASAEASNGTSAPESSQGNAQENVVAASAPATSDSQTAYSQTPQPQQSTESPEDEAKRNLIVNYIPQAMSEMELRALFQQFGSLESCKLMVERGTGKSLGYGFVKYHTVACAEAAIANLSGKQIQEKRLKVSVARPSSSAAKGGNLYCSNMDEYVTEQTMEELFCPYGKVVETKILKDRMTGQSRGVGFVRFETREEAECARVAMNATTPNGSSKPIYVKHADENKRNQQQQRGGGMIRAGGQGGQYPRYDPYSNPYAQAAYDYSAYYGYPAGSMAAGSYGTPAANMQGAGAGYGANPYGQAAYGGVGGHGGGNAEADQPTLFVYNIPNYTDDNTLYQLFGGYGQVTSVKSVIDETTGLCKGFGFVSYSTMDSAQAAIQALNGFTVNGKQLQVSFRKKKN